MISTTRSRSYFGSNVFTEEPAAYLCVDLQPPATPWTPERAVFVWRRIEAILSASETQTELRAAEEELSASIGEDLEQGLSALVATTIERVHRVLGERLPAIQWGAFSRDCGMELIVRCDDAETGRRAGVCALRLLDYALSADEPLDETADRERELVAEVEKLKRFAAPRRPSATSSAIIITARERGIPFTHLDRWPLADDDNPPPTGRRGLLQLGWGIHGRRLLGTATDAVLPETYAALNHRHTAYDRLRQSSVPLPKRDSEFRNINSAHRAARVASRIGYPVVLKAESRDAGPKTMAALANERQVIDAFGRLSDAGTRHVVVERHIQGDTYRLLVIGRELIAAVHVTEPVDRQAPRSTEQASTAFKLHDLSPKLMATAVIAAQCFELPIAAVEIVTPDPALSLEDGGGAVVDIDPSPDLAGFLVDEERVPITAARKFLAQLFPATNTGRIPVCAITGTNGKTTTSRMVAKILQETGRRVGLACTDGVYVEGERVREGTSSGISGALGVFLHRGVDFAVLETSRGTLVTKGLAFERCDAAACTNIASDHLGEEGVETLEQMARLKRVVVESASRCAVLNGDDPFCTAMLPFVTAERTYLTSTATSSVQIDTHVARGGKAVVLEYNLEGPCITLREKGTHTAIIRADEIPATWQASAQHNVANAMFATALALGLDVPVHTIRAALGKFSSSIKETPGRLNVYDKLPFKVVLDFAHNPHGLQALCKFIKNINTAGRRRLVAYWTRDTPRQADLLEAMRIVAPVFDSFICRDAAGTAEESLGKTAYQVEQALLSVGVPSESVRVIANFETAIDTVLHEAMPGDLVVIITGSKAFRVWRQVDDFRSSLEMLYGKK